MAGKRKIFASLGILVIVLFMAFEAVAADDPKAADSILDREAVAQKNRAKWLGGSDNPFALTDPDIALIKDNLIYGQIIGKGSLDQKQQALVILATLTAIQGLDEMEAQVEAALRAGTDPVSIKEAVYQCAPYVGFPRVEAALARVNKVFKQNDIGMPLPGQGTVEEKSRFAKGLATQKSIFGETIQKMHDTAPEGQKDILVNYLTAFCFGDFYTRNGLDKKMRELLVFTAINALGGCEAQAKAHAQANIKVGNTKQNMIDALAMMLPFAGFPRTLNALAYLNEACPDSADAPKDAKEGKGKKK